jgi:hypothetical protein
MRPVAKVRPDYLEEPLDQVHEEDEEDKLDARGQCLDASEVYELRFCESCAQPIPLDEPGRYDASHGRRRLVCKSCFDDREREPG